MKVYLAYNKDNFTSKGFYADCIHGNDIPTPNIQINEGLWEYLQGLANDFKLTENFTKKEIYTAEDKYLFEEIIPPPIEYKHIKIITMEDLERKINDIEAQQSEFLIENVKNNLTIKKIAKNIANLEEKIGGTK